MGSIWGSPSFGKVPYWDIWGMAMCGQQGDKGLGLEVRGFGFRVLRLEKLKVEGVLY